MDDDELLPFLTPLRVDVADHIALTGSYDQCLALSMQLHADADHAVRQALIGLSLPRLAVTAMTALSGLVSYLNLPETASKGEIREMVLAASAAGRYPEFR